METTNQSPQNTDQTQLPILDQSTFQTIVLNHIIKIEAALFVIVNSDAELKNSTYGAMNMLDTTASDRARIERTIKQTILSEIVQARQPTPKQKPESEP